MLVTHHSTAVFYTSVKQAIEYHAILAIVLLVVCDVSLHDSVYLSAALHLALRLAQ
jgi:hypothetical protein